MFGTNIALCEKMHIITSGRKMKDERTVKSTEITSSMVRNVFVLEMSGIGGETSLGAGAGKEKSCVDALIICREMRIE